MKKKLLAIKSYWDALLVHFEKKLELISVMYYVQMESEDQITESGALSLEIVNKVEKEYHKLRELINSLVLKKKTKLQHILNTTHLTSSYVDKGIADPLESLSDIRKQISEVKYLASQRAETVTKIELIQYAQEEIDWLRDSENTEAAIQNERIVKVRTMQKVLPTMLTNLEAELESQADSFIYDGVDVLQTLKTIAKRINATNSREERVAEKIAVAMSGAGAGKMQVEPQVLPLLPAQLQPMDPARLRPLVPLGVDFGFVPRAARTRPLEAVHPPALAGPPSPASPPSPPESNKSDESMRSDESMSHESMDKSDPEDVDYDPRQDL